MGRFQAPLLSATCDISKSYFDHAALDSLRVPLKWSGHDNDGTKGRCMSGIGLFKQIHPSSRIGSLYPNFSSSNGPSLFRDHFGLQYSHNSRVAQSKRRVGSTREGRRDCATASDDIVPLGGWVFRSDFRSCGKVRRRI